MTGITELTSTAEVTFGPGDQQSKSDETVVSVEGAVYVPEIYLVGDGAVTVRNESDANTRQYSNSVTITVRHKATGMEKFQKQFTKSDEIPRTTTVSAGINGMRSYTFGDWITSNDELVIKISGDLGFTTIQETDTLTGEFYAPGRRAL